MGCRRQFEMNITYTLLKNVVDTIHSICWSLGISACQAMMYQLLWINCTLLLLQMKATTGALNRQHWDTPKTRGWFCRRWPLLSLFLLAEFSRAMISRAPVIFLRCEVLLHYLLNAKKCDQPLVLLKREMQFLLSHGAFFSVAMICLIRWKCMCAYVQAVLYL